MSDVSLSLEWVATGVHGQVRRASQTCATHVFVWLR